MTGALESKRGGFVRGEIISRAGTKAAPFADAHRRHRSDSK